MLKDKHPRIAIILMRFPVPSETFIAEDILGFYKSGFSLKVFNLLPKLANYNDLIEQRGLSSININSVNLIKAVYGVLMMILNPLLLISTVYWLIKKEGLFNKSFSKSLLLLPSSFYILKELLRFSPDILHLMWGHYPSIVAFLVMKKLKTKISIFLGAYDLEARLSLSIDIARKADFVWTHAEINAKELVNRGVNRHKIIVSYRGVSFEKVNKTGVSKEDIILFAGRLIKEKGAGFVLDVFSQIKSKHPEFRLVISGSGPELAHLSTKAAHLGLIDSVEFKGHIPQSKLFEEMEKAKFFILPTNHQAERLPNVVKEAIAHKCYCLVSPSKGIEELVEHNKMGSVISTDSLESYVSELLAMIRNEDIRSQRVEEAYKHLIENFDRSKNLKTYQTKWLSSIDL